MPKSSKSTQSMLPKVGFHLERLSKQDLKKGAELYEGGNLSRLMNIAAEYYLELRKTKDSGLEKFIQKRVSKKDV